MLRVQNNWQKNLVENSETMEEMLESFSKVVPILIGVKSDMDAAQLNTNQRLVRMLGKDFGHQFQADCL